MDSKEVLQQYIVGAMKSKSAIAELEKNLVDTSTLLKMQEGRKVTVCDWLHSAHHPVQVR